MSEVVTKGEFARLRGVTPGRVSQWIADGKIGPEAMEGEGRFARIRVAVATAQLKARLDIGQRFGNGLSTDLTAPVPPEARGGEGGAGPAPFAAHGSSEAPPAQGALDGLLSGAAAVDLFDVQIRKEKLVEIQARNRRQAMDDAREAGRLVDRMEVRAEVTKAVGKVLSAFEGGVPELAAKIAARFGVPQRDVLHLMRTGFVAMRAEAAEALRKSAVEVPETVEVDPLDLVATDET